MGTVPNPRTWSVGDLETAALLNAQLRDPLNFLLNVPRVQAIATSAQSIPNGGTPTLLTFTSAPVNNDNIWASGSTFTIQTAGTYEIEAACSFTANATGYRLLQLVVGGTIVTSTDMGGYAAGTLTVTLPTYEAVSLAAGTVIQLQVYQNSGAALNTNADSGGLYARLRAKWISN